MKYRASLTVEAAFVLPLSFYALFVFLSLFLFLQLQMEVQSHLTELSQRLVRYGAVHGYIKEAVEEEPEGLLEEWSFDRLAGTFSDSLYLTLCMEEAMKEEPLLRFARNGTDGFSFVGSTIYGADGEIDLIVSYAFQLPGSFFSFWDLPVVQRVRTRSFQGDNRQGELAEGTNPETLVYVTEKGEVYHTNEYCTYLKASVRRVLFTDLERERNASGGIYYPCKICDGEPVGAYVYITPYGSSFHTVISCREIYKNVLTITMSEAAERGMRKCSKCAKEE